jgi:hypothetical protein
MTRLARVARGLLRSGSSDQWIRPDATMRLARRGFGEMSSKASQTSEVRLASNRPRVVRQGTNGITAL